jgi:DNA-binding transcriptional ArsR family regulator
MTPTRVAAMLRTLNCPSKIALVLKIDGQSSVADLCKAADMAQSHTSILLSRMAALGVIEAKREGKRSVYRVVCPVYEALIEWVKQAGAE